MRICSLLTMLAFFLLVPIAGAAEDRGTTPAQLARIIAADPDNHAARWAFAQAAFQAGRYDLARYHIRQLLRVAQSDRDVTVFTAALARIDRVDPWDVSLNFSVLPSTNVRRSTFNDRFQTDLGSFVPSGGGEEESGIGVTFGAGLAYGLSVSDQSRLSLMARVDRSQYSDADLTSTTVRLSAQHQFYSVGSTTQVEPYVRFRFDASGAQERRHTGIAATQIWWITRDNSVTATAVFEDISNLVTPEQGGPRIQIGTHYAFALDERTRARVGLTASRFAPELEHQTYTGIQMSGNVTRAFESIGRIGVFGTYRMRDFDGVFPLTSLVREDRTTIIGVSYRPANLEIYGTRPAISCQNEVNSSNIALYDYRTVNCSLKFERTF